MEASETASFRCIECNTPISDDLLSFEQRLIDDHDFCRACFEEIMNENNYDVSIPLLKVR